MLPAYFCPRAFVMELIPSLLSVIENLRLFLSVAVNNQNMHMSEETII